MVKEKTITDLIIEFFKKHPKEDMPHGPVVDWVEEQYSKLYNRKPRDTWRSIRRLHQEGFLIKVKKGIYRYDPDLVADKHLEEFSQELKNQILKRDNYKCVICGRTAKEGYELHIDHILPKDKGGKATLDNGQTLCSICNFRKKNYNQTESGKRMFIRLLKIAKKIGDIETQKFCEEILKIYEKYNINGHIEWDD
ncbi:HNH endonuclease [Calditerrivibrio nitroreducens]|uniref:HNH endonuclease n=1 Tax=Calditerrivibrio nitroreducens (strain DSM 19672 / NBRC 101217 / Yu37-1) TaxID=768670 RepID=E4TKB9_CALNY|nr:HNH endonuclease [Calditerrivibrio nitroreducens]ADR19991.1 HNH endonuclease [Calditerrivibrio nitroreducens DSM 19672]